MSRKTKFARDLDRLIAKGELLYLAIRYEFHKSSVTRQFVKALGDAKAREFLKELPNFKIEYQAWYSESLALLKTVLSDRVQDFRSYYEYPRVRKQIDFQNYVIRDYLQGLTVTRMSTE